MTDVVQFPVPDQNPHMNKWQEFLAGIPVNQTRVVTDRANSELKNLAPCNCSGYWTADACAIPTYECDPDSEFIRIRSAIGSDFVIEKSGQHWIHTLCGTRVG